jgi:hypothetical protein
LLCQHVASKSAKRKDFAGKMQQRDFAIAIPVLPGGGGRKLRYFLQASQSIAVIPIILKTAIELTAKYAKRKGEKRFFENKTLHPLGERRVIYKKFIFSVFCVFRGSNCVFLG